MFKQNTLFIRAVLVASLLLAGCSQSDGYSNSVSNTAGDEVSGLTTVDGEVSELNTTGDKVIDEPTLPPEPDPSIIDDTNLSELNATGVEVINGHILPPEPDSKINNATLLGIDSNNNGVRDDVEIWIFHTYKEPIVQAVAMQNARAFGIILVEPSKARETTKYMEAQTDCSLYYQRLAEDYNETIVIPRSTNLYKESKPLILNTRERNRAYYEYNQALSGGIYPGRPWDTFKGSCDFNATKVERGEW